MRHCSPGSHDGWQGLDTIRGHERGATAHIAALDPAWTDEGVTFLEFSPTTEILPVLDHLSKQLAAQS